MIKSQPITPSGDVYTDMIEGLSTERKVRGNRSNYEKPELTDDLVHSLASHNFTQNDIALMWDIEERALMDHHGAAYWKGHLSQKVRRRVLFDRLVREYEAEDSLIPHSKDLLRCVELGAKMYDGLGKVEVPKVPENELTKLSHEELVAMAKVLIAKGLSA